MWNQNDIMIICKRNFEIILIYHKMQSNAQKKVIYLPSFWCDMLLSFVIIYTKKDNLKRSWFSSFSLLCVLNFLDSHENCIFTMHNDSVCADMICSYHFSDFKQDSQKNHCTCFALVLKLFVEILYSISTLWIWILYL